ncbi:SGNH/GDSL hydrolase family protein [Salinibacterium sp. SWN1162]|uniref:SGNH/GDSL hydrolase family protein n=1 Tax=Salinibacterium sp. SWN1162 TaxID=2792053 RepID=UPI0018CEC433|nr:SGNH/GDSL hydrolase family protein [Salinibacterium sp. SWN1162]MBH0008087.1 SGNH/GDSL hydrolase family protein [Salinibacterium sp. SWN1162]
MTHQFSSYVAIGDSFTEGVGDELPDGRVRGWADQVALGLALASPEPVTYANLAIRGRLLAPIAGEQLQAAVALRPQLMSLNGGGNDIMRPKVSLESITDQLLAAVDTATASGIHVLLLSGGNPSKHLPFGSVMATRGDNLAREVMARASKDNVTFVNNWADQELTKLQYWSVDKLHLNARGHARVASNVLSALEIPVPDFAADEGPADDARPRTAAYWREYVLPWIGRRLTGRSSGDNREPKSATLQLVEVPGR